MNPVQVIDLEARWRPLSEAEKINALAMLDDAWALLTTRSPGLPAAMLGGSVQVGTVVMVVCAMVLRVMRNPDGKVQEAIDDYSYRRHDAVAAGWLYVSDDELALLSPRPAANAFSIVPGYE